MSSISYGDKGKLFLQNTGMTFPRNFKRLRTQAAKTQQQIADLFGISRNAVSNWEDETGTPKYPETSRLPVIAEFLNCRVGDFFDDAAERNGFAEAIQAEQDLDAYELLDRALRRLLIVGGNEPLELVRQAIERRGQVR